jgi:two-component system alkaline phosphatase synthesis response regulator PhoP
MAKRVLLVDDSETVIQFEKLMLRGLGYDLVTAKNGKLALEQVASQKPDLILLDLMMPEMDGIETLRRLKEKPESKDIPVVVVTTTGDPGVVEQAFAAGCNDYITKPVDKVELLGKLRKHLG